MAHGTWGIPSRNTCRLASPTVVESVVCLVLLRTDSIACKNILSLSQGQSGEIFFFECFQVVKISNKGMCMKCEICNFMRAH